MRNYWHAWHSIFCRRARALVRQHQSCSTSILRKVNIKLISTRVSKRKHKENRKFSSSSLLSTQRNLSHVYIVQRLNSQVVYKLDIQCQTISFRHHNKKKGKSCSVARYRLSRENVFAESCRKSRQAQVGLFDFESFYEKRSNYFVAITGFCCTHIRNSHLVAERTINVSTVSNIVKFIDVFFASLLLFFALVDVIVF